MGAKRKALAAALFITIALTHGGLADSPPSAVEQEVTIGKKPFRLGATLSRPSGKGPFPTVLLVHGSGSSDRNHGGLFKALAEGLVPQGIAVLRYDKRSRVYATKRKPGEWALEEEVLEDALAALAYLRSLPAVDRKRIVVLGYSLGGMLAPAIAERDGGVAGLVILGGPCRPIEQVMDEQLEAEARRPNGAYSTSFQAWMEYLRERQVLGRFMEGKSLPADLLWERSPAYWQSVNKSAPARHRKGLERPMLVLHGAKDVHVGPKDLQAWRKLLAKRRDVVFREYAKLDHSFRPPARADRKRAAIAPEVVKDVGKWASTIGR
jgi:dienelactone hydrolase